MARESVAGKCLPCPFCGADRVYLDSVLRDGYDKWPNDPDAKSYWICCNGCACHGPWMKSSTGAIRFWNMRTPTPPAAATSDENVEVTSPATDEDTAPKAAHSMCSDY